MDIQWPELLAILKQILDDKVMTEEKATQPPRAEKSSLIRHDQITCARYFDAKTQDYFNIILKSKAIFSKYSLQDYFYRVEFQHRGSPHFHIFFWLKNAPQYDIDDPFYCIPFIVCEVRVYHRMPLSGVWRFIRTLNGWFENYMIQAWFRSLNRILSNSTTLKNWVLFTKHEPDYATRYYVTQSNVIKVTSYCQFKYLKKIGNFLNENINKSVNKNLRFPWQQKSVTVIPKLNIFVSADSQENIQFKKSKSIIVYP